MIVKGSFEVKVSAEPAHDVVDGVALSRATCDKRFSGPLDATGLVSMLAVRSPVEGSAAYVAIERISGTLDGKRGTFVVQHVGTMTRGGPSLVITIAPDSGTGELAGISGRMSIQIIEGKHFYELDYDLAT